MKHLDNLAHVARARTPAGVADHRIAERRSELREFCRELKQNARHLSLALASDVGIVPRSAETRDIGTAVALISFLISPQFEREYDLRLDRSNPIGCVGVILPYNSVFMTFAMSAAAAYLAGNTVLLRLPRKLKAVHAGLSELIGRCLPSMDLLDPSAGSITLSKWLNDPAIDCISCFGDNQWAYDYLPAVRLSGKKFIFEGPGKDPFIVFGDADLERAAAAIVATGTANSGQSCSSPERFYVERSVHQRLVDAIAARLDQLSVGPVEDDPDIGPIYSRRVVERIDSQLKGALSGGARLVRGGTIDPLPSGHGWIVAPTLLTNCGNEMALLQQETFGPIIPVVQFDDEHEALHAATDSEFGLTATVYGGDAAFAARLRRSFGTVFHNTCIGDPENATCRAYWGGFRESGWIWEWRGGNFCRREGPRLFVREFTV